MYTQVLYKLCMLYVCRDLYVTQELLYVKFLLSLWIKAWHPLESVLGHSHFPSPLLSLFEYYKAVVCQMLTGQQRRVQLKSGRRSLVFLLEFKSKSHQRSAAETSSMIKTYTLRLLFSVFIKVFTAPKCDKRSFNKTELQQIHRPARISVRTYTATRIKIETS